MKPQYPAGLETSLQHTTCHVQRGRWTPSTQSKSSAAPSPCDACLKPIPAHHCGSGAPSYLHLKSQAPAASSTLLGCQSRLSTVERMDFLMCLQTHLREDKPATLRDRPSGSPLQPHLLPARPPGARPRRMRSSQDSPVVLLLEVADGDEARSAAHGKLVLLGGPLDTAGGAVDAQDD